MLWRALPAWPANYPRTPADERQRSSFKARWDDTLRLLEAELSRCHAWDAVLEVDIPERWWSKSTGRPRADAQPQSPGVTLRYDLHYKSGRVEALVFPCDTYWDWQDNVRAIALTLKALRAIDRYGASQGRQFAGFKALPERGVTTLSTEAARELIARESTYDLSNGSVSLAHAVRVAKANAHPDSGGSHDRFVQVQEAEAALKAAALL